MKWKNAVPHTKMMTEPSLSRKNWRNNIDSVIQIEHIAGNMVEWAKVQRLEECVLYAQESRHPRAGLLCGN